MKSRFTPCNLFIRFVTVLICLSVAASAMADSGNGQRTKASEKAIAPGNGAIRPADGILESSSNYFANPPYIMAEEVYEKIVKGGDKSYFLVSLQSPDGFAKGHVPGAINIPFQTIADKQVLKLLPKNRKIVLTCDDGHRSMAASLYLNQLGYDSTAMPMGLSHWNASASGIESPYVSSAAYPVSTDSITATANNKVPVIRSKGKNHREVVVDRTKTVLSTGRSLFIDRSEIYEKVVKGSDNNYFLVSIQRPEDYAKGHVPGAINIPFNELSKIESLGKLPADKKIVVICYIGHMAGAASLLLNQLGYEAYDLRFGTLGWNDTTEGLGQSKEFLVSLATSLNYPVEKSARMK